MLRHDYRIEGHVNGRHVLGRGFGQQRDHIDDRGSLTRRDDRGTGTGLVEQLSKTVDRAFFSAGSGELVAAAGDAVQYEFGSAGSVYVAGVQYVWFERVQAAELLVQ